MTKNDEIDYNSDEDINRKQHSRLLDEVLQLDKRQYVKKATRTEPTTHVSEFNLVKQASSRRSTINIADLIKSLKQKSKHATIGNKVKKAQKKANTLRKPLEKPQAERIRRSVGFEKSKNELNKWNAIVEKNRVAAQLTFPLNDQSGVEFVDGKKKRNLIEYRIKSELDIELEKLKPVIDAVPEPEEKFPLSLDEIMQRRKEMAKLRAHQSYQEAKAYKRNKIKSKTFHRIARKERVKQQIKEFELLQKTDPEEALRKLEHLEKTRVEERMSLRHRSTGQWAKNKQIRAKYDKESRQALAQQLSISRELTQKVQEDSSDSETETNQSKPVMDDSNPWVSGEQTEYGDFVSGYRKFWNEKNKIQSESNNVTKEENVDTEKKYVKTKNKILKQVTQPNKKHRNNKRLKTVIHCNSSWVVTSFKDAQPQQSQNIADLFEDLEYTTQKKVAEKLNNLKKRPIEHKQSDHKSDAQEIDLKMPSEKILRPILDEEIGVELATNPLKSLSKQSAKQSVAPAMDIDPNKYITVKPTNLATKLPDMVLEDDDDETDQRAFITEAFEDDDVVADFNQEKRDLIDKDKPEVIDLSLPGWGSWGGTGIVPNKRKKRRFIMKKTVEKPRRDENKGDLIINELKDTKIKQHQVSELPFPFKSVKDFEASIRAPIGDTFVPQTAFRRLIKPGLITKKGAVIEPMSEEVLLKQKFTQNGFLIK